MLLVLLVFSVVVWGEMISNLKLSSVSDFSYTMGGKQSVSITLRGKDREHYLELTIHRNKIQNNFEANVKKSAHNKSINASATWDGYYSLNYRQKTSIYIKITKIDKKNKIALLDIRATLYNYSKEKSLSFNLKDILIDGENFDNLLKQIK